MPQLSVVIPTYNEERYLPALFACLKRQDLRDFEVIVADNKSTDKTRAIAKRFGALVCAGGLPGIGRNKGAALAKGQYLVFLDADVQFNATFLRESIAEFIRRDAACATARSTANSPRFIAKFFIGTWDVYVRLTQQFYPHAAGYCIFTTRAVHRKIGGFDESILIGEDSDYVLRASKKKRFLVLGTIVLASTRRFDSQGYWRVLKQLLRSEWYRITTNEIRSSVIGYEFNGYK